MKTFVKPTDDLFRFDYKEYRPGDILYNELDRRYVVESVCDLDICSRSHGHGRDINFNIRAVDMDSGERVNINNDHNNDNFFRRIIADAFYGMNSLDAGDCYWEKIDDKEPIPYLIVSKGESKRKSGINRVGVNFAFDTYPTQVVSLEKSNLDSEIIQSSEIALFIQADRQEPFIRLVSLNEIYGRKFIPMNDSDTLHYLESIESVLALAHNETRIHVKNIKI